MIHPAIRVHYLTSTAHPLDREEAISFLGTGELPERVLLATSSGEQIIHYGNATPEQQAAWRRVGGSLTISSGHLAGGKWQPDDKQECQVWFDYSEGCGRISVSGNLRDLGTSLGFLRAQAYAVELLAAAETQYVTARAAYRP
jgi:hypothetical protein